jgi:glycosyltransferase involved in cell wall biosynthesis
MTSMRLSLVTDAWSPQVNGVVTTLQHTVAALRARGVDVDVVTPEGLKSWPCPSYPEIRLALFAGGRVRERLHAHAPDAVHIATEGPLGLAAHRACRDWGWCFTTSYHTRFPEYLSARWPVPESWSYAWLRRFHGAAVRTLVGTPSVRMELEARGFRSLAEWSRGVDTGQFRPHPPLLQLPWGAARTTRPVLMYVGRVAVEKNIEAFLALPGDAVKVVVGDGPARNSLAAANPEVVWAGYLRGESLALAVAQADCLVFPSRTDTFGLVMLEAMACGVPVAAYPVPGPLDVVQPGVTGELDVQLERAVARALRLDRAAVRAAVMARSWDAATAQFLAHLTPIRAASRGRMRGGLHAKMTVG